MRKTIGSPRFVVTCLTAGDDAADRHDLAVAPALELAERRVGLAAQLVAHARERMLGDVEAERLLLEPQQLRLLELAGGDRRMVRARPPSRLRVAEAARRRSTPGPSSRSAASFCPCASACSSTPSIPIRVAPVESSAPHLTSDSSDALVDDLRVDALGEVPDRRERAALLARRDDRAARRSRPRS